jgi:hypothetical protein
MYERLVMGIVGVILIFQVYWVYNVATGLEPQITKSEGRDIVIHVGQLKAIEMFLIVFAMSNTIGALMLLIGGLFGLTRKPSDAVPVEQQAAAPLGEGGET